MKKVAREALQATHTHSWRRESHHPCLNLVPELNGIALLCLQASCAEFVVVIFTIQQFVVRE